MALIESVHAPRGVRGRMSARARGVARSPTWGGEVGLVSVACGATRPNRGRMLLVSATSARHAAQPPRWVRSRSVASGSRWPCLNASSNSRIFRCPTSTAGPHHFHSHSECFSPENTPLLMTPSGRLTSVAISVSGRRSSTPGRSPTDARALLGRASHPPPVESLYEPRPDRVHRTRNWRRPGGVHSRPTGEAPSSLRGFAMLSLSALPSAGSTGRTGAPPLATGRCSELLTRTIAQRWAVRRSRAAASSAAPARCH